MLINASRGRMRALLASRVSLRGKEMGCGLFPRCLSRTLVISHSKLPVVRTLVSMASHISRLLRTETPAHSTCSGLGRWAGRGRASLGASLAGDVTGDFEWSAVVSSVVASNPH